jgi:hypothetical protein
VIIPVVLEKLLLRLPLCSRRSILALPSIVWTGVRLVLLPL